MDKNSSGFILITALVFLIVISLLSSTLAYSVLLQQQSTSAHSLQTQAETQVSFIFKQVTQHIQQQLLQGLPLQTVTIDTPSLLSKDLAWWQSHAQTMYRDNQVIGYALISPKPITQSSLNAGIASLDAEAHIQPYVVSALGLGPNGHQALQQIVLNTPL